MPVTLSPLGVRCNLQCGYCYEDPQRDAGNWGERYDVSKMKEAVAASSRPDEAFLLFGGEPLLLPKDVLKDLWGWGFRRSGKNSVQTNGTLIDADHIALFKEYKVAVGISLDGPGVLNDARWDHTLEKTRLATQRTEDAILRLCQAGIPPSLIVTLHRLNATGKNLETLISWFHELCSIGVRQIGLHMLEVESEAMRWKYQLPAGDCVNALIRLRKLRDELPAVKFSLLDDLENLLMGNDSQARCIWRACDPYTTPAVKGIGGQGTRSKCSRVNKEGVDSLPTEIAGYERYLALYETPQEAGGCKNCRFFLMCRGQCPGTAIGGDWRNRSEQCQTWMQIFEIIESELLLENRTPLSVSPLRADVEHALVASWKMGSNPSVDAVKSSLLKGCKTSEVEGARKASTIRGNSAGDKPHHSLRANPIFNDHLLFELPSFARLAWVSAEARDGWKEKLVGIRRSVSKAEWVSVVSGFRAAAIISVAPEESGRLIEEWKRHGLKWEHFSRVDREHRRYLPAQCSQSNGESHCYIVCKTPLFHDFISAWNENKHSEIASLLGCPKCCGDFLQEISERQSLMDTTWAMAKSQKWETDRTRIVETLADPSSNILLSSLGIRAVPHRPCCFDCKPTRAFAGKLREMASNLWPEEAGAYQDLDAVLEWPAEWSALHGIAEVKTPILRLCTPADSTADRYVVKWTGRGYPEYGARGLSFPYRTSMA